jgi:hypothetical protein
VGGPHAMEPIGSLTIYSLLSLLGGRNADLANADVEWNIIPCIDPDGAVLNEGWTQQPFSFDLFVRNYFVQPRASQPDFSFPIAYKSLVFDSMSHEARILQQVLDIVRPDFYFRLHDYGPFGGSWFALSRDIGASYYEELHALTDANRIAVQQSTPPYLRQYASGIREIPTFRLYYDYLESHDIPIPRDWLSGKFGTSSGEYALQVNSDALLFVAELTYGSHPYEASDRATGENLRHLSLRVDADSKYLAAVILEEWDRLEKRLNSSSLFYDKISRELIEDRDTFHEGVTQWYQPSIRELLHGREIGRMATERDQLDVYLTRLRFLCHAHAFIRLLWSSERSSQMDAALRRLNPLFASALFDIDATVGLDRFRAADPTTLAKVQLGSGLIALNSVLETRA